ncbi:pseudouridine synthase [Propionigenium maris]|nr:pseudouridine synthase [Propionigenium maris]
MRINKYLSSLGVASRREVDRLVDEGLIKVNGEPATSGMKVSSEDEIEVRGKVIETSQEKKVYYILNKPKGVISAAKDDRGRRTVVDMIDTKQRIYPIGRLDFDTTGLILLTNDGELFNRIIHPRSTVYKSYFVVVKGEMEDTSLKKLAEGVELEDGRTLPAKVRLVKSSPRSTSLIIEIREGRNRQIRRMCSAVGHPVYDLKREKIGRLGIRDLAEGQYRELTDEEVRYLYSL